MRALPVCAALLVAVSGCDRSVGGHVSGRIVFGGVPRTGVVLALGTSMSAPIDARGRFDVSYERLNVGPFLIPLLVVPTEGRPFLLQPRRDFSLLKCGKEWVGGIYVDAMVAKPARPLRVTCVASECTATIPAEAGACSTQIAMLHPFEAPTPTSGYFERDGVREITFKAGKDPLVIVADCNGAKDDFVSDVIGDHAAPTAGSGH